VKLLVDFDFVQICKSIVRSAQSGSKPIWNEDEFQRGRYSGGWCPDGDDGPGYYFSFYAPDGGDYIFKITLEEADLVCKGVAIDPKLTYWKQSPLPPDPQ